MKSNPARKTVPLMLAATAIAAVALAAPQTHVVIGQNDDAVDRTAIQAAIDGAQAGDTIELRGLFQLDGESILIETSNLTVAGHVVDDDGDGSANEDWADGADNDGDGLVDEDGWDATLQGVDDGAGGPAGDAFPDRFNDGFEILGFDDSLTKIAIRDIRFTRLNRAVYLFPDYDDDGTVLLCASSAPAAGTLGDVTIERNTFDHGFRGVEVLGRVDNLRIDDNLFRGVFNQSVVMFGNTIGCAEADGSIVTFLPLGIPSKTRISGNVFAGGGIGVLSFVTDKTSIACNRMSNQNFGVISIEDGKLQASRNEIDGDFIALLGTVDPRVEGPESGNSFKNNQLSNNVFGVIVDCDTTGYRVSSNLFQGSLFVDVLLDGTNGGFCGGPLGDSFENTAIVDPATSVLDFGRDNRVIVGDDPVGPAPDCDAE